ncbi:ATP-binding protein [Flavobacterium columnare]|uniref:ATPase AAA n=2 Tax=Flavobacterium columnare TaxID=996 RepID=G8X4N1_FLACA|nr:ATP-binding protein [Flavobacterium columnare]AEW85456.1 ATPase AAA [Flavobacterium columnare ATCC 49512]AMO20141.1 ATP-binding protein [Flavobacterium columnare]AUX18091.1 AAA family ATPase [Flavobacterium columnare]PTD13627.1 ATP-binding protein [Flavobacterium columnare]QOG57160.1 ATP-binding protein [Flavobacterium columnare]
MSQFDYIKDIAKYGLENDQEKLLTVLNELIEHSKNTKKLNFAIQLQSILKDSIRLQKHNSITKVGSDQYFNRLEDKEVSDLILEKITSDYSLSNIVIEDKVKQELEFFIEEHHRLDLLQQFNLPVSNKLLLHGSSGCGKTLASYVIAGELKKMMIVLNLGAVVSSKLGETSKNLSKIFKKAALEDCIIFLDEFDSIGKIRDYSQDHGEMKRVVNTILQLFDYLPQSSIVIAATNQKDMLDDALLRRFDNIITFSLPTEKEIKELINLTLKDGKFAFKNKSEVTKIIKDCKGLSYYSIQKTLINAIKKSLFASVGQSKSLVTYIDTTIWKNLIAIEIDSLNI